MTANEKDTTAAALLAWTAKKEWGSSGLTHYGRSDGWKFTCDLPRKGGLWVVRGWGPDGRFVYREGITLAAVKTMAEDIVKGKTS